MGRRLHRPGACRHRRRAGARQGSEAQTHQATQEGHGRKLGEKSRRIPARRARGMRLHLRIARHDRGTAQRDARPGGSLRRGEETAQYGGIQRFHHRRIPARHPVPLHRRTLPPEVQPRVARRIPGHLHHAGGAHRHPVPRRRHRGECGGRPVPVDLRVARRKPRRIPHVPERLPPAGRSQTLLAERHPPQFEAGARSREQPHHAVARHAEQTQQLADAGSGRGRTRPAGQRPYRNRRRARLRDAGSGDRRRGAILPRGHRTQHPHRQGRQARRHRGGAVPIQGENAAVPAGLGTVGTDRRRRRILRDARTPGSARRVLAAARGLRPQRQRLADASARHTAFRAGKRGIERARRHRKHAQPRSAVPCVGHGGHHTARRPARPMGCAGPRASRQRDQQRVRRRPAAAGRSERTVGALRAHRRTEQKGACPRRNRAAQGMRRGRQASVRRGACRGAGIGTRRGCRGRPGIARRCHGEPHRRAYPHGNHHRPGRHLPVGDLGRPGPDPTRLHGLGGHAAHHRGRDLHPERGQRCRRGTDDDPPVQGIGMGRRGRSGAFRRRIPQQAG